MPVSAKEVEGRRKSVVGVQSVGAAGSGNRNSMVGQVNTHGRGKENVAVGGASVARSFGSLRGRASAVFSSLGGEKEREEVKEQKTDVKSDATVVPVVHSQTPSPLSPTTASPAVEDPLPAPSAPFMQSTNLSSSSVPSMSSVPEEHEEEEHEEHEGGTEESDASTSSIPETPSLSRASSLTEDHEHEHEQKLQLPPPRVEEAVREKVATAGEGAMEVRVEIVGTTSSAAAKTSTIAVTSVVVTETQKQKQPVGLVGVKATGGRATLKRAWRRVVGFGGGGRA